MEVKGYPKVRVAEVKKAGKRINFSSDEGKTLDQGKDYLGKAGQMYLEKE